MVSPIGPGRLTVIPISEAVARAASLNNHIHDEVESLIVPEPRRLLTLIRSFLLRNEQEDQTNQPESILKFTTSKSSTAQINLGPSIDNGDHEEGYFHFDSGARLSFGITLKEESRDWRLLAFRFHLAYPDGHSPLFIRFDLNSDESRDPLMEPRCHIHVGNNNLRIPGRVMSPLDILDRIFYVLAV